MKVIRTTAIASLLTAILATGTASAQTEPPPTAPTFEFHGFVVGTLYTQNQVFLSGQGDGILIAAPPPALHLPVTGVADSKSGTFTGGDVRQTRPIFVINGPGAWGAKVKGHFEFDLFGPPAPGALGYESAILRLRQAYGELKWGNTTFDAGQHSAQILLAQIPATMAHITNPVPYGAGIIGWRTIGFRAFHAIPVAPAAKLELGAEISHGKWNDAVPSTTPATTYPSNVEPGNNPALISQAWASSSPQLVGRVKLDGKAGAGSYMAWVAGSYESINLKGFGDSVNPTGQALQDGTRKSSLTSYALVAGGNVTFAPITLQGQVYTGRATAPLIGSMLQFGDIGDLGAYAQLGFFATKQISLWAIGGFSSLDKKDLQKWANPTGARLTETGATATTLRSGNTMYGAMARFMDGGYGLALEYYGYSTKYLLGNLATDDGTKTTSAYQLLLSGGYFF